jgi:hypothetical protein
MQNEPDIAICTPQTPPKQRQMIATDLLKEIQIILRCETSKLIDLPQEIVVIDNNIGDVTLAHLKCSIAVTAGTRAHKHYDQTGKSDLDDEDHIKKFLLQVIAVDEEGNDALAGILWLCLHIQKSPISTEEDHQHYYAMFSDFITSLKDATVEPEFQSILASAVERVSEISLTNLDRGLTTTLLKTLNIDDVEDLQHNLRALKIKAININTSYLPYLSDVMGWSSSGEIYICSDHKTVRYALKAIKDGEFVPQAKLIVDSLVLHEGGHCVARKRARECGNDPTLFSTPSTRIKSLTSSSKCLSINQCGIETGYLLETIVFGAVLDPVMLWASRQKFPEGAEYFKLPLHGLCRTCGVQGIHSASLPTTKSKDTPSLGFSCGRRRRPFR